MQRNRPIRRKPTDSDPPLDFPFAASAAACTTWQLGQRKIRYATGVMSPEFLEGLMRSES